MKTILMAKVIYFNGHYLIDLHHFHVRLPSFLHLFMCIKFIRKTECVRELSLCACVSHIQFTCSFDDFDRISSILFHASLWRNVRTVAMAKFISGEVS